jgi:phospholipase/carboxylesterase
MDLLHVAHVPPGEGPFPAVLCLHGWGASAHDLFSLAPILHGGAAIVLCPQGPLALIDPQHRVPVGYGWWDIQKGHDPEAFAKAVGDVRSFLDEAVERYPIDPRKIVVMGFSQGGVVGYDLVLSDPARFAGLVALSSWLPDEVDAAIPSQDGLENFPALVIHGTEDPMIPVDRAQQSHQKLQARGLNVTYREYPMEHEISHEALAELVRWLEEKVFNLIQLA